MRAIEKGGKVPVTVMVGTEEPFAAEIRRLNNKPGHLQFRYENKAQERLRLYLQGLFGNAAKDGLLEVSEVAPFVFFFKPILRSNKYDPDFKREAVRLVVEDGMGIREVERSLGITYGVLKGWVQKHRDHQDAAFVGIHAPESPEA
jgi:transposase